MHTEATELKGYIITEIERFLNDYKKYENKVVVTAGIAKASEAKQLIEDSRLAYYEKIINWNTQKGW
jgi:inorganic pyrophosphatase